MSTLSLHRRRPGWLPQAQAAHQGHARSWSASGAYASAEAVPKPGLLRYAYLFALGSLPPLPGAIVVPRAEVRPHHGPGRKLGCPLVFFDCRIVTALLLWALCLRW